MSEESWQDVKTKVEGLGLKLKLHLEQEKDQEQAIEAEGGETDGGEAARETQAAIEEIGAKLQDAVNSLGNAAKDPAIRADLKDLGQLLRDAMNETFSTVGAEVGDILKKTKGEMAADKEESATESSTADDAIGDAPDESGT